MSDLLSPIIGPIHDLLFWIQSTTGFTWAWSIILLTLLIRIVLVPLVFLQVRSMRGMAKVAPQMQLLKKKYPNDAKKLQEEMMALYKEHGVNPFSSCLPMLPQLPVFFSLFYVLRHLSSDIKNGKGPKGDFSFLGSFIPYNPPAELGIAWNTNKAGIAGIVLMVFYVVSQLASTVILPQPGMDPKMRRIFLILPFASLLFVYRFPIGLMLYWVTSNIWTFFQQLVIRKLAPQPPAPPGTSNALIPRAESTGGKGLQGAGRVRKQPKRKPAK